MRFKSKFQQLSNKLTTNLRKADHKLRQSLGMIIDKYEVTIRSEMNSKCDTCE